MLLYRAEKICDREYDKIEEKQLLSNAFIACGFQFVMLTELFRTISQTQKKKNKNKENLDSLEKIYLSYKP